MPNLISKEKIALISSQVLSTLVMLITGKIIAVKFEPSEFGTYGIQYAVYMFIFSCLLSPVIQFLKTNNNNLNKKIGYRPYIPLFAFLCVCLLIVMFFYMGFSDTAITWWLFIGLSSFCFSDVLLKVILDKLNTDGKLITFAIFSFFHKLSMLIFLVAVVYLFTVLDSSLLWMYMILATAVTVLFGITFVKFNFSNTYKISTIKLSKKVFIYAIPLSVMSIFAWFTTYFDRFAIEHYLEVSEVGIYSASYGVGTKFAIVLIPIFLAAITPIVYGQYNLKEKKLIIEKYAKSYMILAFIIIFIVYLAYPFIGLYLLSEQYEAGFHIIPSINLGYFLLTFSYIFESLFYSESKTSYILYLNVLAALLNIILNIILIPIYGIDGAVIATVLSSAVKLIVVFLVYKKL
jgi:O-antigen/teichoic acid export membrane protein